jgi:hypothetical protein
LTKVARRSRFAAAAEEWLQKHASGRRVSTKVFWEGLSKTRPDLTTPSEGRKTPKATCMRDLRNDPAFELGAGMISLKEARD